MRATLLHKRPMHRQRGAAALVVTLLLFFVMALVAVFVNRNLVFEQRSAANQVRATQAFEAAEAGLEWALAHLNGNQRLDANCAPTPDAAATSFRTRYLEFDRASRVFAPVTWGASGGAAGLRPSCVRAGGGWACSCPTSGEPVLAAPAGATPAPAFTLQFRPTGRPGVVRVSATGCTSLAGACAPGSATRADATATLDIAFGLLGALHTAPAAALTLRGALDVGTAALGLHNADPATGIAVHAGGAIAAANARIATAPGASTAGALIGNDAALAALSPERFFSAHFGADTSGWQRRPGVTRLACSGDCSAALAAAVAAAPDSALVWIDGDATLAGPLALGSPERPALIVVSGSARLSGAVALTGVLHAAAVQWRDTPAGAFVRGAVLSEAGYTGNGAPDLVHDAGVLGVLAAKAGTWARVSGSWRDF